MISVVLPTMNDEATLADALTALVPGAIDGAVQEVILADGGSSDGTLTIAEAMGARVVPATGSRGAKLAAGAAAAKGGWLLFLNADAALEPGWLDEVETFLMRALRSGSRAAAVFRFALDDPSPAARRTETWARLRFRLFRAPLGDQGLLIERSLYEELGGFRDMPVMEDVDLMQRIGADNVVVFRAAALSSAERFRSKSSTLTPLRNLAALVLYHLRVPPRVLARVAG